MTGSRMPNRQSNYVCPVCGRRMMSANTLCSGGFLDDDHPSNVRPVVGNPPLVGRCGNCDRITDTLPCPYCALGSLAADAGIDTSVCEFCSGPLDDSEPWRRGLDGCGAHERCLKRWL